MYMKIYMVLWIFLIAGCQNQQKDSDLLGKWQIMHLEGKDSSGKNIAVYDVQKDSFQQYITFITDTTFKDTSKTTRGDTLRYLLVGDTIFSNRGIRNYTLELVTNDSILIKGDDQSVTSIKRLTHNKQ